MGNRKAKLKSFWCQTCREDALHLNLTAIKIMLALGALIQDLDNLLAQDISENTPYRKIGYGRYTKIDKNNSTSACDGKT